MTDSVKELLEKVEENMKVLETIRIERWNLEKAKGKRSGQYGEIDSHTDGHEQHKK